MTPPAQAPSSPPSATAMDPTVMPSVGFSLPNAATPISSGRPDWRARVALGLLHRLAFGRLQLTLPDGQSYWVGGRASADRFQAALTIHRWSALSKAVQRGDIGFGEAYMDGDWSTPDLAGLLELLSRNRQAIAPALYGNRLLLWVDRLQHLFRSNTRRQSRKNIQAHYDLGNAFYRLWLDASMTYSSALFDQQGAWGQPVDLAEGQKAKIHRALEELAGGRSFTEDSHILEIGCGWGGLALERLQHYPGKHLGITLSPSQKAWAEDLLSQHGLADRAEIRLQDYRDTPGRFDGIVSIEMIEAVGLGYWPTYFQTLKRRLKPQGRAVIQAILIDDALFDRYSQGTDFIQKYIFPGGMLLTPSRIAQSAESQGLRVIKSFSFGPDYGRTLHEWLDRFDAVRGEVSRLGYDERFIAMWRFYLGYCEAGFRSGDLDVVQVTLGHDEASA